MLKTTYILSRLEWLTTTSLVSLVYTLIFWTDVLQLQVAFGGDIGPDGEVWTTYSEVGQYQFRIIFSADINNHFNLRPSHTGLKSQVIIIINELYHAETGLDFLSLKRLLEGVFYKIINDFQDNDILEKADLLGEHTVTFAKPVAL